MDWESNYKSMSFEQLLTVKMPMHLTPKERREREAFIGNELRIKAPKN